MSCKKVDLRENINKGMERQKKILELVNVWYKAAAQTDPPPVTEPSVLSYNSKVSYYYTSDTKNKGNILNVVMAGLTAAVQGISGVKIDYGAISNLVTQSLTETTQQETSQGYSTCVLQSYEGEFQGKKCLYKPMIVAVSFNFSASEYKTSASVVAYGYWVYLLCTAAPFGKLEPDAPLMSIDGEPLKYKIPHDMQIVGRRYMTKAQLDAYRPGHIMDLEVNL